MISQNRGGEGGIHNQYAQFFAKLYEFSIISMLMVGSSNYTYSGGKIVVLM